MTPLQQTLVQLTLDVNARATIKDAADLDRKFDHIGLDSLEVMSLMLGVMERFDIKIADAEVDKLMTLNELARFVESEFARLGRKA